MASQNSVLTETQREFLQASEEERKEQYTKQQRFYHRNEIHSRVQQAFKDFGVLLHYLDESERDQIFDVSPGTKEYIDFNQNLKNIVQFIYVGLGGHRRFNHVLIPAVRGGEAQLGIAEYASQVKVEGVDPEIVPTVDTRTALNQYKYDEWDNLPTESAFNLLRLAKSANAVDVDALEEELDIQRWLAVTPPHSEWKRKGMGNGQESPAMPPEIYEEGIDEMSAEELRKLFPKGPYSRRAVYDGEKVYIPPRPDDEDDEPEILHYVNSDWE